MIPIEEEMKGKVAVITGANTGIGFGCAKVFSEAGMNVVMAARRKEKGEAAAAELNAAGKGEENFLISHLFFYRLHLLSYESFRQLRRIDTLHVFRAFVAVHNLPPYISGA